ncbi:MAG: SDR family NAD(P)-dependent oxidoreductase [bacterium]
MQKRSFDILVSFVGLVLTLPFFLILGILIKCDSRGPVFFKQIRVGKNKKPFTIFKFRTMVASPQFNGLQVTPEQDSRITSVGKWLRKFKLDELPQLWNVLKGDMSMVGPRPEVPKYVAYYDERERLVFNVRPGVTDLASIYYRDEGELLPPKNTEEFYVQRILPEKLRLNLNYMYNRGFWFDLKILVCTILISFLPAFSGKWMRTSQQTSFAKQLANSFSIRLQKLDATIRGYHRWLLKVLIDMTIIATAYYLAFLIRFDGHLSQTDWHGFLRTVPILVLSSILLFNISKIYQGLWKYASIKELVRLVSIHSIAWSAFIFSIVVTRSYWVPRSVLVIYWSLALLFLGGIRMAYRILYRQPGRRIAARKRVLVVGAGNSGEMIVRQMINNPHYGYVPIAFVDDKRELKGGRIHGVPVLGSQSDIAQIVFEKDIHEIIIAIPSATAAQIRQIVSRCERTGVKLKTIPGPREIINGDYHLKSLREVNIEDLLHREPLEIDQRRITSLITGEFVLVTGAGGSIGQELCKQISQFDPAHLILLDRSENSLFYLENDLRNENFNLSFSTVVGDVTDVNKCNEVFQAYNPRIVFHAAAHKHVPLMELNPEEAIKNNVGGTMNMAYLSKKYGVKNFVLISTDKAVAPTSIMGASKRLAEFFVQALSKEKNRATKFSTVRFGNVLGSNGSVMTLFQKQIAKGGPVTITDPEMTRYFMTISEAVSLILYASTLGAGGEIFILDMGEPIKVVDMAKHFITLSGYEPDQEIPIQYVGRRPGEKLHEALWNQDEFPRPTACKKIYMTDCNGINPADVIARLNRIIAMAEKMDRANMFKCIGSLLPDYRPQNGKNGKNEVKEDWTRVAPSEPLLNVS